MTTDVNISAENTNMAEDNQEVTLYRIRDHKTGKLTYFSRKWQAKLYGYWLMLRSYISNDH